METRLFAPKFSQALFLLATAFISGCKEDEALTLFINDLASYVEVEVHDEHILEDPCLLANGRAAAKWYQALKAQHREALKLNVQRYVHAVKFEKSEIVSGVPVTMARTQVRYNQGTIIVTTKGVLSEGRVFCAPDIDVLYDFTSAHATAANAYR